MKYKSYTVYDDADFFDQYIQKRAKGKSPNDTLEKPIIEALVGDAREKEILDLGCGDAMYGKSLVAKGAKSYHGIDGSTNMVQLAKKNTENTSIKIEQSDIETYPFPIEHDLMFIPTKALLCKCTKGGGVVYKTLVAKTDSLACHVCNRFIY